MYIVLTDILTCPRCGPEFGLVVRADEIVERRVVQGVLGCANCREQYPIAGRVADLRLASEVEPSRNGNGRLPGDGDAGAIAGPAREDQEGERPIAPGLVGSGDAYQAAGSAESGGADAATGSTPADAADQGYRVAALLGVGPGAGPVLVDGRDAAIPTRVGELLPNAVVVGGGRTPITEPPGPGWIAHGRTVPFRDHSLRAVALLDDAEPELVRDAARAVVPGGRIVIDPAPAGTVDLLAEAGLEVILDQDGVVVASVQKLG